MEGFPKDTSKNKKELSLVLAAALAASVPSQVEDGGIEATTYTSEALEKVPQVSVIELETGEKIYAHEDETTTEIMEYLSGRSELTEADIAAGLRKDFFNALKRAGEDITSAEIRDYLYSIDSREKVTDFYEKYSQVYTEPLKEFNGDTEAYANHRFQEQTEIEQSIREKIDDGLYQALWEIYIRGGAPRIEWVDTSEERSLRRNQRYGGSNYYKTRDSHDNEDPTMYLDRSYKSDRALAAFLDELAHSFSHFNNPEQFFTGIAQIEKYKRGKDLTDPVVKNKIIQLYNEPGTEEYLAHQVIAPILFEFIGKYHPSMQKYLQRYEENREELRQLQSEDKPIE